MPANLSNINAVGLNKLLYGSLNQLRQITIDLIHAYSIQLVEAAAQFTANRYMRCIQNIHSLTSMNLSPLLLQKFCCCLSMGVEQSTVAFATRYQRWETENTSV